MAVQIFASTFAAAAVLLFSFSLLSNMLLTHLHNVITECRIFQQNSSPAKTSKYFGIFSSPE